MFLFDLLGLCPIREEMKKSLCALMVTTALSSAELSFGGGITQYFEDTELIGAVDLSVVYGSISYEIDLPNEQASLVPEIRIGTGIAGDTIDNAYLGSTQTSTGNQPVYADMEFSVNTYMSFLLNAKYDWGKVYGLANINATYMDLEASASALGVATTVSESDWMLGAGLGLGIELTEKAAIEFNTEIYSVSDSIALSAGAGVKFTF